MRVLHVAKFYPPHPGGMESFLRDLAVDQAGRGVESLVLAHAHAPGPAGVQERDGVRVVRAPCCGTLLYAPLSPAFPALLRRHLREFRPDLVHAHLPNLSAFWSLLPGLDTPLVVHWHADVLFPRRLVVHRLAYGPYSLLERALLRRARRIIATSPDYLAASRPLAPFRDKCRVVPLGLDETRLGRADEAAAAAARARCLGAEGRFLILAAGRFAHYKGFPVLARALARVAQQVPGTRLAIAGDGEERELVLAAARQAGAADSLVLPGRVSDAELAALMRAADIFCLPSLERTEAFGMVLLEAMAAGLPLVTTAIPGSGVTLVNRHGETGLAVPPGDASALAEALIDLLRDAPRRLAMGRAARERLAAQFSIARTGRAVLDVYAEALGRPAGAAA